MSRPLTCNCHSQYTRTHTHTQKSALTQELRSFAFHTHFLITFISFLSPSLSPSLSLSLCSYKCCSEVRARRPRLFNGPSVCQLFLWGGRCVGRRSRDLGGRAGAAGSDRWRGVRLHSFSSMRTTEPHFKKQGRNLLAPIVCRHMQTHTCHDTCKHTCALFWAPVWFDAS